MVKLHSYIRNGKLAVWVRPSASRNSIEIKDGIVRVSVTAIPEKGKANQAVIRLLARTLGIAKSDIRLIRGETGRDKIFEIL